MFFKEILWIESQRNYIKIQTQNQGILKTYLTLSQAEKELPASDFLRIQKSFIVYKNAVDAIEGNQVVIGNTKIPFSRNNRNEVIKELTQNRVLERK